MLSDKLPDNTIRIRGARQHNLKNIDLELPRDKMIVFTGVSGSGKSSLAFDTIFAEGQRRYVESLSAYARQFLGQVDKPDVDSIEGLSPAISIDQKSTSHNPRSTVGTVTEIYDYLRLLFGRAGEPHCPECDRAIAPQSIDQMCDRIMELPDKTRFQILAPVVRGKKGTHKKTISSIASEGFARVRIDGEVRELSDAIELDKNKYHDIEIVVDRLVRKDDMQERLVDSLRTCLKHSSGIAIINIIHSVESKTDGPDEKSALGSSSENPDAHPSEHAPAKLSDLVFSENFACPEHGAVMEELSPRLFSFNSPYGACPDCHGLGSLRKFSPDLIIPNPTLPVYAAIAPWSDKDNTYYLSLLCSVAEAYSFDIKTPWEKLRDDQKDIVLYGSPDPIWIETDSRYREAKGYNRRYEGALPMLERQYQEASSDTHKQKLEQYLIDQPCETCSGFRLKPESLAVRIGQFRIHDLTGVSIRECLKRINELNLTSKQAKIADLVLREIRARLSFLLDVGLD